MLVYEHQKFKNANVSSFSLKTRNKMRKYTFHLLLLNKLFGYFVIQLFMFFAFINLFIFNLIKMPNYTNAEIADIHFVCGLADRNVLEVRKS